MLLKVPPHGQASALFIDDKSFTMNKTVRLYGQYYKTINFYYKVCSQPKLVSSITLVSDTVTWSITYDRNIFTIQATGQWCTLLSFDLRYNDRFSEEDRKRFVRKS